MLHPPQLHTRQKWFPRLPQRRLTEVEILRKRQRSLPVSSGMCLVMCVVCLCVVCVCVVCSWVHVCLCVSPCSMLIVSFIVACFMHSSQTI